MALDVNSKIFVVHVAIREREIMAMDPDKKAQIKAQIEAQIEFQSRAQSEAQSGVKVGALILNEAPIEVLVEYSDYSNVFSVENAAELPENSGMNEHAIELEEDKQILF